ncbi:MAG: hypothetical protein LBS72_05910 [Oscillospiraceae bacterium]|jgi:serine kinase of HPr protein (carbohydrate metabolism regulator)|nr:hypothetical protein [Oscillospiraceae bacterium]
MKISRIMELLDADVLMGDEQLDLDIRTACGSDLMSDVLAFVKDHTVLLTGLTNPHVVRTAEMLDVGCVVFARGKRPTQDMLDMARDKGIVMLATKHTLYVTCGILYKHGLPGTEDEAIASEKTGG